MPKSPPFSPNAGRVIDVLTYPAVQLLDVTGPVQVFASANKIVADAGGAPPYVLRVVAQGGESQTSSAGVTLEAGPLTQNGEALDTLLIAGGEGAESAAENLALISRVRTRASQARRIASVCTGAFVLAEAGLLDGRRAATHWQYIARFAQRFPAVHVESVVLIRPLRRSLIRDPRWRSFHSTSAVAFRRATFVASIDDRIRDSWLRTTPRDRAARTFCDGRRFSIDIGGI
jgi:putative intracellular protease/amidase